MFSDHGLKVKVICLKYPGGKEPLIERSSLLNSSSSVIWKASSHTNYSPGVVNSKPFSYELLYITI
jgi:hypothetical protein